LEERYGTESRLKPFAYVTSEKRILHRILLENDIQPDATGITNPAIFPDTFKLF